MPSFVRRNYLLKFGFALLVVVFAIAVGGTVALASTTATLEDQVSQQLQTEGEREAEDLRTWREQRSRWLNELSKTQTLQSNTSDERAIAANLKQELRNVPSDVRFIYYINRTTTEVLASNRDSQEGRYLNETNASWARGGVSFETENEVLFSDVYWDQGTPVVAFTTDVTRQNEFALVAISATQRQITRLDEERRNRKVTVIDPSGRIVMDTRGTEFVGQQYADEIPRAVTRSPRNGDSGFLAAAPNQEQLDGTHVAAYAPLRSLDWQDPNWIVITHAPEDEVYLVRDNVRNNLIVVIFISLVGLTLIGIVIAGGTVRSINRLANRVGELEEGDLDTELSSERDDEIGQLYDGFDSMRRSLKEQIDELSEAVRAEEQMRKQLSRTNRELDEQRVIISVLNRLLRHNLRNSLTSILLRTEQLSEHISEEQREEIEIILRTSERLMRRAEKSQAVEQVVNTDPEDLAEVNVVEAVETAVDIYSEDYPSATISTDLPGTAHVRGGEGLSFIVENIVENALEHNDRQEPIVDISVDTLVDDGNEWVELQVVDNGPGIPEMEIQVLESGEETPLEHGSGIGLWLINWLVGHMNGELVFEDHEPRGTVVTVRLPTPEAELEPVPAA